jgi:hypothetical protein
VLYPPGAPHISEFKKVLIEEFGCEFKTEIVEFGPSYSQEFVRIERDMDGEILEYPFYTYEETMRVHGALLLSICKHLRLDCSRWGVTLDTWYDPEL